MKFDPPLLRFIRVGFFNHLISNDPTAGLLHSPKKDFLSFIFPYLFLPDSYTCVCTVVVDWNMLQSTVRDAPGATVKSRNTFWGKKRKKEFKPFFKNKGKEIEV